MFFKSISSLSFQGISMIYRTNYNMLKLKSTTKNWIIEQGKLDLIDLSGSGRDDQVVDNSAFFRIYNSERVKRRARAKVAREIETISRTICHKVQLHVLTISFPNQIASQ